jgi:hypothetical protein
VIRVRSKSTLLLIAVLVVATGAAWLPIGSAGAAAKQAPGSVVRSEVTHARLQRVGTVNVRQLAARAESGGPGLSTNLEREAGPWIDLDGKEGAPASNGSGAPSPAKTPVSVKTNIRGWEGLDHADQRLANGGNQFSLEPPDQGLCVGNESPNDPSLGPEVVESVNDALVFYDASAEQFTNPIALTSFYGLPPSINRTTGVFGPFISDPKCYFDPDTERWFHTVLVISQDPSTGAFEAPAYVYMAVSTSSEALGSYFIYRINATDESHPNCPCFGDQPLIGADKYGFYISTAEYDLEPFGAHFTSPQIYAMSKTGLESGSLGTVVHIAGITHAAAGRTTGTVQPAASPNGAYATGHNGTEYFLSGFDCLIDEACAIAAGPFDKITIWALTNTKSLATASPSVHLSRRDLTVGTYATPVPQHQKDGPRPLGTLVGEPVPVVNANDSRMNQVVFAHGRLWSAINTAVNPGSRDGIEYFIVQPFVSDSGAVGATIPKQGYVSVADAFLSFPSIGVRDDGRGFIAMSLMGPNNSPSAAQIAIDDQSGVKGPVEIVRKGLRPEDGFTCYEAEVGPGAVCRWGDYSASVAGPDGRIYSATEMISDNSRTFFANWSTFIWPARPEA